MRFASPAEALRTRGGLEELEGRRIWRILRLKSCPEQLQRQPGEALEGQKFTQERPKSTELAPRAPQEWPESDPAHPKSAPENPETVPKVSPEASRRAQKRAQEQFKRGSSIFANFEPRVGHSVVLRGWAPPGSTKNRLGGRIAEGKKACGQPIRGTDRPGQ